MKEQIYYTVESKFWRRKIGNKLDNLIRGVDFSDAYVNDSKAFCDASPIEARKAAFNYYQCMIDVLYDGIGENYADDSQARSDLQHYMNSNNEVELGSTTKFKITDDVLNGIEVYMIIDKPLQGREINLNGKYCIHGIRYVDYSDRLDEDLIATLKNLLVEHQYYHDYNYPTEEELVKKDFKPIGGSSEFYLKTPFDWDVLMEDFEGVDFWIK